MKTSSSAPSRSRGGPAGGRSPAAWGGLLLLPLLLAVPAVPGHAQTPPIEERIRALAEENAREYLRPLAEGLSYALTGGLFDRAAAMRPFGFDLGVRAVAAFPPAEAREFQAILPTSVDYDHPVFGPRTYQNPYAPREGDGTTPTLAGEGPGVVLVPQGEYRNDLLAAGEDPEDYEISFPAGSNLRLVPTAILHLSVGVGFGTEVSFRYLPDLRLDAEVGDLGARGWGVKHTLTHWFASPLDVAVALGRQELEVGEYLEASSTEGWLFVGRALGPLTLFGAAGLRRATVDVVYTLGNPAAKPGLPADGTEVRFSHDLESVASLAGGARIQLLVLNISGQYTVAEYDTFSLKVALGIP